jgi:hypothetical protein
MGPTFVVVLSIAAGAATYIATVRAGRRMPTAVGFDSSSSATVAAAAVGSAPAPDDDVVVETQAQVVDLDAARMPPADAVTVPVPSETDDAPGDDTDDAATTTTLAPVNVTAPTISEPEPGYAYLRVSTQWPSWRDRIAGIIGIAVLLVLGSAAIAFGIYQLGSGINALVQRFLNG